MNSDQLERLKKRLEAIPKTVLESVKPALQQSGNELASTMRQLAPVDEGYLKESIAVTMGGESTPPYSQPGGSTVVPENAVAVTAGNEKVRYAHLQEYGTANAPAQPFFWPSYRLNKAKIKRRLKRAVSQAVKKGWDKS